MTAFRPQHLTLHKENAFSREERKAKLDRSGYVIGRVAPLCAGGPDEPGYMEWQARAEAKVKSVEEKHQCASTPRGEWLLKSMISGG